MKEPYLVIEALDTGGIEKQAKRLIADGYVPCGGACRSAVDGRLYQSFQLQELARPAAKQTQAKVK